jgi:hypothetical protein
MSRMVLCLPIVGLSTLAGCNQPPPSPQTIADQHRFEVGCRAEDAQGYEGVMPYCGHQGGRMHP